MAQATGSKCKKANKNKSRCERYRIEGRAEKNALRKARTLLNRLEKRNIRLKDQAALKSKIKKIENRAWG